jgi:pimeloyl-ACP methyl ester carboxylesterase
MMTDEKFVDANGVWTRYFEKGSGETLVLFHGSHFGTTDTCGNAFNWELNFDSLARWFRVIAVDKLGQGYTDNPKSDDDYTMAAVVSHAYDFLSAMGLRKIHLVGHSRGGYLVARLTLEHPEIVRSLIIVDSGTLAPGPSKTQHIMARAPEPRLSRESQRWVLEHYSYSAKHITEAWLDAAVQIAKLPKYQESVQKMEEQGLKRNLFLPQLILQKEETLNWIMEGRLKAPTLVVWGYNDPSASLRRGQALFEMIAESTPVAEMHVINQAGHFCYREQPEQRNSRIRGKARRS